MYPFANIYISDAEKYIVVCLKLILSHSKYENYPSKRRVSYLLHVQYLYSLSLIISQYKPLPLSPFALPPLLYQELLPYTQALHPRSRSRSPSPPLSLGSFLPMTCPTYIIYTWERDRHKHTYLTIVTTFNTLRNALTYEPFSQKYWPVPGPSQCSAVP